MEHEHHHNNNDLEDMKRNKLCHFTKCRPKFKFRLLVLCSLYIPRLVSESKIRDDRRLVRRKRIIMQFMRGTSVFKGSPAIQAAREEVDSRSVYVGNVDYSCTAEIVRQHFQECGVVNRVTILTNSSGHPKGCAYVEFMEIGSVNNALLLNESVLHGRILKVCAKRTNIPGVGQFGRRLFGSRAPFNPTPGYGRFPRFRRPTRYRPY